MGRTNPTYRNQLDKFIERFKPFKKALRKENKKHLDNLWEKMHQYGSAGSYMNSPNPGPVAVVSMLLGLQKETDRNTRKIEELEHRIQKLEQ